ncbi:MAG: Arm DNA-binding domain-containing protein [Sphingopyxis terrae]|uniref:Arm DNA-binding domain-containing protein n=1 Tax=Sphingopyxis terrae TaxID=33052 RepID=UPI003F7E0C7D
MLSTSQIRALLPRAKPYKVAGSKGLFLLVQPSGSLLWRAKYRYHGVERKIALGRFPEVSLHQARLKRDEIRAKLADDIDECDHGRAGRSRGHCPSPRRTPAHIRSAR